MGSYAHARWGIIARQQKPTGTRSARATLARSSGLIGTLENRARRRASARDRMSDDAPELGQLLMLARELLQNELVPVMPSNARFTAALIANALRSPAASCSITATRIVPFADARDALIDYSDDRDLIAAIRSGALDVPSTQRRAALAYAQALVRRQLAVTNPGRLPPKSFHDESHRISRVHRRGLNDDRPRSAPRPRKRRIASLLVKNQSADAAMVWYDDSDPDAKGRTAASPGAPPPAFVTHHRAARRRSQTAHRAARLAQRGRKTTFRSGIASYELHEACRIVSHSAGKRLSSPRWSKRPTTYCALHEALSSGRRYTCCLKTLRPANACICVGSGAIDAGCVA